MLRHRVTEALHRTGLFPRRLRAVWLVGCLSLTGCYRLVPVNVETVTPPMRVRAYLSPEASQRIAPVLGEARSQLDGRLVETTPQGIFLEVPAAFVQEGFRTETLTQKILLERGELMGLQRRQLDRTRTLLVTGAGAVAVGALVYDALSGLSGESLGGRPPGGPPEARIPLLSIPLR